MKKLLLAFGFVFLVVSCGGGGGGPANPTTKMHVFWWLGSDAGGYTLQHHWGELGSMSWNSQAEPGINFSSAASGNEYPKMTVKGCETYCSTTGSMPSTHTVSSQQIPRSVVAGTHNLNYGDVVDFYGEKYLLFCENEDESHLAAANGTARIYRDSGSGFNDFMSLQNFTGSAAINPNCGKTVVAVATGANGGADNLLHLFVEEAWISPGGNEKIHHYCIEPGTWVSQGTVATCDVADTDGLDFALIGAGSNVHLDAVWDPALDYLAVTDFSPGGDSCGFSLLGMDIFDKSTYTDADWSSIEFYQQPYPDSCWDKKIEWTNGYYVVSSLSEFTEKIWLHACDTKQATSDCMDPNNWFHVEAIDDVDPQGGTTCVSYSQDVYYDMKTTSNGEVVLAYRVSDSASVDAGAIKYASFTLSGNSFVAGQSDVVAQTPTPATGLGTNCNNISIGLFVEHSSMWRGYEITWGDMGSMNYHQGTP